MIKIIFFLIKIFASIKLEVADFIEEITNFYNMIEMVNEPDIRLEKFKIEYNNFINLFELKFNQPVFKQLLELAEFMIFFIQIFYEKKYHKTIGIEHIEYLLDNYLTKKQLDMIRTNFTLTVDFENYSIKNKTKYLKFFQKLREKNRGAHFIYFSTQQIDTLEKLQSL